MNPVRTTTNHVDCYVIEYVRVSLSIIKNVNRQEF